MDIYEKTIRSHPVLKIANFFRTREGADCWGPRVISDFELILMVEGRSEYITGKSRRAVNRNEVLLIPPGVEHTFSCRTGEQTTISCIHFDLPGLRLPGVCEIFAVEEDPEVLRLFMKSAQEFERREHHHEPLLNRMLGEIWVRLVRSRSAPPLPKLPAKLVHALNFLEKNYREQITRSSVSDYLGITPEHLNFLFRKHLSTTPMEHLTELRLKRAKQILHSAGRNVAEAAYLSGFNDPLYFSRLFRKRIGVPPSRYARMA
jgi:AraC-like DNA-binding protein